MIPTALVQADRAMAAALRRVLTLRSAALALLLGTVAGLIVKGLPDGELAADVFAPLVAVLTAVLVLPLVAGVQTAERHGGFEQLVAVRPIGSAVWTLGRVSGSLGAALLLAVMLAGAARVVGGTVAVPRTVEGTSVRSTPSTAVWRFPLPAGSVGPFELRLQGSGSRLVRHTLGVEVARGGAQQALAPRLVAGRSIRFDVPGLAPARGDLFVTLHVPPRLVLAASPPRLVVGMQPLGREGLPLPVGAAARLALAALAAVAAACVFRFETACLAGLLGLTITLPPHGATRAAVVAGLLLVALLGTALARRAALP